MSTKLENVKVRIKDGAAVSQDFRFMRWPSCLMPNSPLSSTNYADINPNPNMIFTATWTDNKYWDCWAPGYGGSVYGRPGTYGNGSIFVTGLDGVEIIKDTDTTKEDQINQLYENYINNSDHSEETRKVIKQLHDSIKDIG